MIRREFIRLASLAAGALAFVDLKDCESMSSSGVPISSTNRDLVEIFREPANQYRPMVRWW